MCSLEELAKMVGGVSGSQAPESYDEKKKRLASDPTKGHYDGKCNVTMCEERGARSWNKVMNRYYCADCARRINESSNQSDMGNLCSYHSEEEAIDVTNMSTY